MPSQVVGSAMRGTPRRYSAAAVPTRSPVVPPPSADPGVAALGTHGARGDSRSAPRPQPLVALASARSEPAQPGQRREQLRKGRAAPRVGDDDGCASVPRPSTRRDRRQGRGRGDARLAGTHGVVAADSRIEQRRARPPLVPAAAWMTASTTRSTGVPASIGCPRRGSSAWRVRAQSRERARRRRPRAWGAASSWSCQALEELVVRRSSHTTRPAVPERPPVQRVDDGAAAGGDDRTVDGDGRAHRLGLERPEGRLASFSDDRGRADRPCRARLPRRGRGTAARAAPRRREPTVVLPLPGMPTSTIASGIDAPPELAARASRIAVDRRRPVPATARGCATPAPGACRLPPPRGAPAARASRTRLVGLGR